MLPHIQTSHVTGAPDITPCHVSIALKLLHWTGPSGHLRPTNNLCNLIADMSGNGGVPGAVPGEAGRTPPPRPQQEMSCF